MLVERFGVAPVQYEYRACGHFSGEEVRQLMRGGTDPRTLGCPESIFLFVLEKRSVRKATRSATAAAPPVITDDDRRRKAQEVAVLIQQDAADAWLHAPLA